MAVVGDKHYVICAEWDKDAALWVASSDQVPGLAVAADSMEQLVSALRVRIPELLGACDPPVAFEVRSRGGETIGRPPCTIAERDDPK